MSVITRLLLLCLTVCGVSAIAIAQTPPTLVARPGLCILPNPEAEHCTMTIQLDWSAAEASDICLHSSLQDTALRCWENTRAGRVISEVIAADNIRYWLQHPNVDEHFSVVTVQVVRLAQRNPERRRRRHIWSVL